MESHYGVGINNRYALFLDSDAEDDVDGGVLAPKKPVVEDNKKVIKDAVKPADKKPASKEQKTAKPADAVKNKESGKDLERGRTVHRKARGSRRPPKNCKWRAPA